MDQINPPPALTHLFTLRCAVAPPTEIGTGPYGRRRCVPIESGSVKGKYVNGEVVPGGADFMSVMSLFCLSRVSEPREDRRKADMEGQARGNRPNNACQHELRDQD